MYFLPPEKPSVLDETPGASGFRDYNGSAKAAKCFRLGSCLTHRGPVILSLKYSNSRDCNGLGE